MSQVKSVFQGVVQVEEKTKWWFNLILFIYLSNNAFYMIQIITYKYKMKHIFVLKIWLQPKNTVYNWDQSLYRRTYRQTDKFLDNINRGMWIFFKLNLLTPYSLCSQGDKDVEKICKISSFLFCKVWIISAENES